MADSDRQDTIFANTLGSLQTPMACITIGCEGMHNTDHRQDKFGRVPFQKKKCIRTSETDLKKRQKKIKKRS